MYGTCVANKMVNGEQCTLCWYIYDNKVSHVEENENKDIVETVSNNFGELSIYRGKKCTFLGMDIELTDNGMVKVGMK